MFDCILKALGEDCEGEPKSRNWFSQLKANICDKHYKDHLIILALSSNGSNAEELLTLNSSERRIKLAELSEQSGKTIEIILEEAYNNYEQEI